MATLETGPKKAVVAPAAPRATEPGEDAVRELLAPLDWGEAPQIGVLGDTGAGKSTLMRALVEEYLRRSPGWAIIVDDKGIRPKYSGQERRDLADLRANPVDQQGRRVLVLRGDPRAGVDADPEEAAELAWKRAGHGWASLIVHDELVAGRRNLIVSCQWRSGIEYVPKSFTKGREVQIGDLWGAQSPSEVPIDPFEQSSAIATFRLNGLGLAKLIERNYVKRGDPLEDVIRRLPAMNVPPEKRGEFVVLQRGIEWNGKVYKLRSPG